METELTKKIKVACHSFKPAMSSNMRTIRYADEVSTPTGYVDVIRFEDYKKGLKQYCRLIDYEKLKQMGYEDIIWGTMNEKGKCKDKKSDFPNKQCKNCIWRLNTYEIDMLITCYEIKISVSDFKSKNGHNFHGNKNYYVVDSRIFDKIKDLVPKDIGIIVYFEESNQMRIKREATYKEISDELKTQLLYNALKKWVDGKQTCENIIL